MSVDFTARMGIGWIITKKEYDEMNILSQYEYEDMFHYIDAYYGEGDIFFGELVYRAAPGSYKQIDFLDFVEKREYIYHNYGEILSRCGRLDLMDKPPNCYLIHQVH